MLEARCGAESDRAAPRLLLQPLVWLSLLHETALPETSFREDTTGKRTQKAQEARNLVCILRFLCSGFSGHHRVLARLQRQGQHFIDRFHWVKSHVLSRVGRQILQIRCIAFR